MTGPIQRLIRAQGVEYTAQNADGSGGDRTTPTYEPDGTLTGVLERRARPVVETLSSGEEVETDLELRTFNEGGIDIVEAGQTDYPTKLAHPDGLTYRVLAMYPEDSGVTVLTLERE